MPDVLASRFGGLIDRYGLTIGQALAGGMTPQVIHGIELGRGFRQQANWDVQVRRQLPAGVGGVLFGAILKQHNLPTPPVRADQAQKSLMCALVKGVGHQQNDSARLNVHGPMQHPSVVAAGNRHAGLFTDPTVATGQGRCF